MKKYLIALCILLSPQMVAARTSSASHGAVSAADPRGAEAGQEILQAGGSAADAAMAMMLAMTVVEPQSSGIGGGGFLVYHDTKSGATGTIDGREKAPASASPTLFMDGAKPMGFLKAVPGGRSVGIPGNVALMALTHRKWGRLKWAQLFGPAIRLADGGFQASPRLAASISAMGNLWQDFPAIRAIYWQDGRPKAAGETIRNPELAKLFRQIARRGPSAFYTGANAQAIIDAAGKSVRNPTVITAADLSGYRAKERTAVCTTYRIYKLCGMGPPSSGATTVFQILGQIERFDMKALGKDSPKAWHLIAESMRLAYADREKYLADADFVDVPVAGLIDKTYIASRSALISETGSLPLYEAGVPPGAKPRTAAVSSEVPGTTHFIAVDGQGNVATMTSTVESAFGSQLVANGYVLNNQLTDFTFAPEKNGAPVANRVEAGKRPVSSMSPTIVFGPDGKPVFTVGAAGGKTIIMQVAKTLIAHLDWGLSAQDSIAMSNIYYAGDAVQIEAGTPTAALATAISAYGRPVVTNDMPLKTNAAERTSSGWKGAADPRSEGVGLDE
jgi:gamma-glutamyltranspeptidase / glutathione hydrolase